MDILEHLTEEHRKAESLISQLKSSEEGPERDRLLDELTEALEVHMAVEERFLYPIMTEAIDAETTSEATDEHQIARDGLASARDRLGEGAFEAAMDVLAAGIAHHVEEEEQDLFPKLRERAGDQVAALDPEACEAKVKADDATRDELYEQAKEQGVEGRSTMSKDELAEAVKE